MQNIMTKNNFSYFNFVTEIRLITTFSAFFEVKSYAKENCKYKRT